ncbi:MAG TPA: hypothetical protein VFA82_04730 [Gaiellaceae bacterium]|nr:hypothetical protein [Gaiellaceae bacterium]
MNGASTTKRAPKQIRDDIAAERDALAASVERLRAELGRATSLRGKLPVLAAGAAGAGFLLGGGIRATLRVLARRRRRR